MSVAPRPHVWRSASVGDLVTIEHGYAFKSEFFSNAGTFAVTTPGNFYEAGGFRLTGDRQRYYTGEFVDRYRFNSGELIVAMTEQADGLLGSAALVPSSGTYLHNQRIGRIRAKTPEISLQYLYFLFNTPIFRKSVSETAAGTKVRHTSPAKLAAIQIPVPPLSEQCRIVDCLVDMECNVAAVETLIAKKQAIKQGIIQALLTQKTRLRGFTSEWNRRSLRSILDTPVTDGPHSTPEFLEAGIPFLSVNNIVDGRIDFSDVRHVSRRDHEIFSRKCAPRRGDILLGKAASVGKVAIVETDLEFNIWSPLAMIRVGSGNVPKFVYYQLQGASVVEQIVLLTNSSSQGNIGMSDIEKLELDLPSREEQLAISGLLSDLDEDVDVARSRLRKAKAVKEGMTQALLSGLSRLPIAEASS